MKVVCELELAGPVPRSRVTSSRMLYLMYSAPTAARTGPPGRSNKGPSNFSVKSLMV
jgi:hypothetical protein